MGWLTDPFTTGIGLRALVALVLLGAAAGPLGVWLLLHRQAYAAESLSHGMLPGLVLAALAGAPLLLGAAAGAALAAALVALLGRDPRISADAGVALAVTALFGLGAVLALSPQAPPRLEGLLFGDLLGISGGELAVTAAVAGGVALAATAGRRALALAAFDPVAAPSLGTRPARAALLVLLLLAAVTVVAVQALGSLLALALLIAPGAAALQVASRLGPALGLAATFAVVSGAAGLLFSYHAGVAAGASVALCALACFGLALLAPSRGRARPVSGRLPAELLADGG